MTKIILSTLAPAQRLASLRLAHPSVTFVNLASRAESLREVGDADAYFGSITNDEFLAARQLKWVQSASAGVEWMWKIPTISETDVVVTNARGAHAQTIAEHTFMLLLSQTRAVKAHLAFQARHEWARGDMSKQMVGIKGLTMGILGFGNIGRAIARRAIGFEMDVLAVDAHPSPLPEGVAEVWGLDRLDEMCTKADVLVISAPITPQTRDLIGPKQIGLLKPGSFVIAVSRGGIVNEPALIEGLKSGHIKGAGLDVQATEPMLENDPLWSAPNLMLTPHDSGASNLTTDLMWSIFHENVGHFVKGSALTNQVDKKLGY